MKKNKEKEILREALAALEKQAGLKLAGKIVAESAPQDSRYDFAITLAYPKDDIKREFLIEVKKSINSAIIGQAAFQTINYGRRLTYVTEYVTQPQAEKFRKLDIPFFDTAGNAYLHEPGLFVLVSGNKKKMASIKTGRIFHPPGMRLIYSILTKQGIENKSIREISALTGVPVSTVAVFLSGMEKQGYMLRSKNNKRTLVKRSDLFRRFVENYGGSFRQTLKPIKYTSTKFTGRWWDNIDIEEYGACWGGETGGALLTKHLRPETATVYADSPLQKFQLKYGLVTDPRGNFEILRRFWKDKEEQNVAPPLIIYADLMATAERRNIETAKIIYEKYLTEIA